LESEEIVTYVTQIKEENSESSVYIRMRAISVSETESAMTEQTKREKAAREAPSIDRRQALARLGLGITVAYAAPVLLTLSEAAAKGGSGGGSGGGGGGSGGGGSGGGSGASSGDSDSGDSDAGSSPSSGTESADASASSGPSGDDAPSSPSP
jgi:hypothetical protein